MKKRGDLVKIIWYPLKNETVVLRMIYIKCSNDSIRLWWNWQFCEKIWKLESPHFFHRKANNNNKNGIATLKNKKEAGIDDVQIEHRTQSSQMAALNAKRILHRETNLQSMGAIKNYCNTETGERLSDTEKLQTYIHPMSHVETVRTSHLIWNSTISQTTDNQGASRLQTREVMLKSTIET